MPRLYIGVASWGWREGAVLLVLRSKLPVLLLPD